MARDELEEMSFLWDGTENWVLWASYHHETDLKIVFAGERPSIKEVAALRKLLDKYRDVPTQQVLEQVRDKKELPLGKVPSMEARDIIEKARRLGLGTVATDASHTGYSPIKEDGEEMMCLIIEDEELSKRAVEKMLAAGVPVVQHTEVD